MWGPDRDNPATWASRWAAGPNDTQAQQARRINAALEVEKRLVPFGAQQWVLHCDPALSSGFYLEAEHAEIPHLILTIYAKGLYSPRDGKFREHDQVFLRADYAGENCRGERLCVREFFREATAVADAVAFIARLPKSAPRGMVDHYEVLAPVPEEEPCAT